MSIVFVWLHLYSILIVLYAYIFYIYTYTTYHSSTYMIEEQKYQKRADHPLREVCWRWPVSDRQKAMTQKSSGVWTGDDDPAAGMRGMGGMDHNLTRWLAVEIFSSLIVGTPRLIVFETSESSWQIRVAHRSWSHPTRPFDAGVSLGTPVPNRWTALGKIRSMIWCTCHHLSPSGSKMRCFEPADWTNMLRVLICKIMCILSDLKSSKIKKQLSHISTAPPWRVVCQCHWSCWRLD